MLVGVAQQVGEDRRHAGHHGRALGLDQPRQRLGLEEAAGQHQVGAGQRRSVRQPPGVGVEHRHDDQRPVARAERRARRSSATPVECRVIERCE